MLDTKRRAGGQEKTRLSFASTGHTTQSFSVVWTTHPPANHSLNVLDAFPFTLKHRVGKPDNLRFQISEVLRSLRVKSH